MNRKWLVVMLGVFAAPAYSTTATVTSSTQAVASPAAPGSAAKANATTGDSATKATTASATPDAAPGKSAAPNAVTLTRPAAALSAPDVPLKSTATPVAKSAAAGPRPSAILPSTASPAGAAARSPDRGAWAAIARGNSGVHRGTLEAMSISRGTFQVYGQKLTFDPQRVKVFNHDGKRGSILTLKNGANLRFTLDAADPSQRRVAVIYLD